MKQRVSKTVSASQSNRLQTFRRSNSKQTKEMNSKTDAECVLYFSEFSGKSGVLILTKMYSDVGRCISLLVVKIMTVGGPAERPAVL
jgi:hypothetical protein